jgi:enolase
LIDYYIKFCNEHPAISYLEDPIADSDVTGWQKVFTKFVSKPNVIISTKNLVSENLKNLKNVNNFQFH